MAKIANRRFHVEDGARARTFEVGDEVPDEYADRYDPKLVDDGVAAEKQEGTGADGDSGGSDDQLSPEELAEFEGLKTIEQVNTWVQMGGPHGQARARHALAAEQEGGQRKGLIEGLEAYLAGNGG